MQISLPNFDSFTVKSPNITQRSISQESAFKKSKNPSPFLRKTIGLNNSFTLTENNFRFSNTRFCMHFSQFVCHVLSKICLYDQKHTLFSNFACFCTPKRCTRVQCLVLKNNPNYMNFWTSLIPPLTFECPPQSSPFVVLLFCKFYL